MKRRLVFVVIGIVALVVALIALCWDGWPMDAGYPDADTAEYATQRGPAAGPLRVHPGNRRYFTDGSGRAIYLTGSHTWNNLQDISKLAPIFEYDKYLQFLQKANHNFIRLWMAENAALLASRNHPLPYRRPGSGTAFDGEPKFDMTQFNQEYFDRLRSRVSAARDQGIYVAVMLFQGASVKKEPTGGNPWRSHPFHRENNVNGIDGDLNGDDEGKEIQTLQDPKITALQEQYVRKVVDTLSDLDNVLWEISNESDGESTEWQYHMIRFIKRYEADQPMQHPVGMTFCFPGGKNADLFDSPADWISPNSVWKEDYCENPPAGDGRKVIVSDTDHLWGVGGDGAWVWKSFTRGLNPIFMDPFDDPKGEPAQRAMGHSLAFANQMSAQRAMGHSLAFANRMNLAAMAPRGDLASSGYCLANPGEEYLVYVPLEVPWLESRRFFHRLKQPIRNARRLFETKVTLDLSSHPAEFRVEWFNPSTGGITEGTPVQGGVSHSFIAPFKGDAVLYVRKGYSADKAQ